MEENLVEILLPLQDNEGNRFGRELFEQVAKELSERFGGATAFVRSPAKGLWETQSGQQHDEIVVIETMAEKVDEDWWRTYRKELERRFHQDAVIVRCHTVRRL